MSESLPVCIYLYKIFTSENERDGKYSTHRFRSVLYVFGLFTFHIFTLRFVRKMEFILKLARSRIARFFCR